MISRLRGFILEKQPPLVLLEVGGVGYEIRVPITCFRELPNIGSEAVFFIHFFVREDTRLLFGFNNKQERIIFRELIKINGIGPKLALIILSELSVAQFIHAVECSDLSSLIRLPGVGKKTAERLIIEMRGRFKDSHNHMLAPDSSFTLSLPKTPVANNAEQEAISALIALGYKPQEAARLVNNVAKPNNDSESLIRDALRSAL